MGVNNHHIQEDCIIVKGVAGLGNRLYTVASAIDEAERLHARIFVDWMDGQIAPSSTNQFYSYFELPPELIATIPSSAEEIGWGIYDVYLHSRRYSPTLFRILKRLGVAKRNELWLRKTAASQFPKKVPCIQDKISRGPSGLILLFDFLPPYVSINAARSIRPNNHLEELLRDRLPPDISSRIAIHIRNTDKRPPASIDDFMSRIKEQYPAEKFFLATDDIEIRDKFAQQSVEVFTLGKDLPIPKLGKGIHQLRDLDDFERNVLFENSLIDFFALDRCKTLMYQGNSSFSSFAAYRRQNSSDLDWTKW